MTIKWTDIEAECDGYREGFVAIFRRYEGQPTDEKDAQGRTVKVTVSSFARHAGIPEETLRDWVKTTAAVVQPRQRDRTRESIQRMPAADKAKLVAELLDDEAVTEQVISDPVGRRVIAQTSLAGHEADRQRSERKRASDPVGRRMDENIALLDLQLAINGFVRKANELLPNVGPVPAGEHHWLNGETERLEAVTEQIRYLADHGETRTDAELRAMTGGA